MLSDAQFYLQQFANDVQTWEQRLAKDKNDRLVSHYTLMSQLLREKSKLYLTPLLTELKTTSDAYAEKYKHKDLPYHLTSATNNATFLKTLVKELVDLYEKQTPYDHILIRWNYNLASLKKRITTLRARLTIIQKILAPEEDEHEKA